MKTNLIVIALFLIFCSGCSTPRYAYSPSAHNVPLLTKQGDSKIAVNYSNNGPSDATDGNNNQYSKNYAQGVDVQGAVAVTKSIAVEAAYFYRAEKTNTDNVYSGSSNSAVRYRRNLFELGAGFFTAFDTKKHVMFQVFAGAGFGKTMIKDNGVDQNQFPYTSYYNTGITKYYLEPAITFRPREIFSASIATRLSVIQFRNITSNYTQDEKLNYNLDSLNRYPVVFFEPAFVGSFGFNKLPGFRIEFQVGFSLLVQDNFIDYRPVNFSLGLVFDIRKLINAGNN